MLLLCFCFELKSLFYFENFRGIIGISLRQRCHMPDNYKGIVRRLVEEVWSDGQPEAMTELIHPNAKPPHGPWGLPAGPDGFRRLISSIRTSFPDLTRSVEDMVAEGDRLVLYYRIQGTHTGNGGLVPYPPTGQRWDMLGATAFRFADDLIVEEPWAVNDVAAMLSDIAKANVRLMMEEGRNNPAATHVSTYYAKDFAYHDSNGSELQSRSAYEYELSRLLCVEPPPRLEIEGQVSEGDCVLTRYRLIGYGLDDGVHMSLIRFDNGLAVEQWDTNG